MSTTKSEFTLRIRDEEMLRQFDDLARGEGTSRNDKIEELMGQYVSSGGNQFFTLMGFSDDGLKKAELRYSAGRVRPVEGAGLNEQEETLLAHAEACLRRGTAEDFPRAIDLFERIFGAENVFRRDDTQL